MNEEPPYRLEYRSPHAVETSFLRAVLRQLASIAAFVLVIGFVAFIASIPAMALTTLVRFYLSGE